MPAESIASAKPGTTVAGEPRRPALAWLAFALLGVAAAIDIVALLVGMWRSVHDFANAAWLQAAVPTSLGDPLRVLLVFAIWLSAVAIAATACVTGYYAWSGYGWTRWAGLIAIAVGCLAFLGNSLAPWCLAPLALGAGCLWLPPMRRFFAAWRALRHPAPVASPPPAAVSYGPLPKYL